MLITVRHGVERADLGLGVVRAEGVQVGPAAAALADALTAAIEARHAELSPSEEAVRSAARELLRNGRYKPTGRGKPASEYLLRAAREGFPRINGPVDANNLVSLLELAPISLWDLDLAATSAYTLRLGRTGEQYVFNASGQVLDLEDLVVGCADDRPIVSPVKDSHATKIHAGTTRVAGLVLYPLPGDVGRVAESFLGWLRTCGANVTGSAAVARPGESVSL